VEITQPDLFNNGMVVIHGLKGFIAPFSCDVERMTSFPFHPDHRSGQHIQTSGSVQPAIMRLMLRDAMLRLRNNGFSILALPRKVKYAELVTLNNMTVSAVDDLSIFSGFHSYIRNVKIVVHSVYLPFPHILIQSCGCGLRQYPRRMSSIRRRSDDGRNVCCSGWAWRLW